MNIANALGAKVTVRPRVTTTATTATTATVCDMYAPRTSAGVLLDDATTLLLRRWMDGVADVDVKAPTAFVTARVGSGVSTLLRLLVSELGLEGVWIHAGTPRIADVLEDVGRSRVSVTGRRKIVIVDEFDAVSADKVTISAIVAFAKTGKLRMVCAGHASRSSKASEFATKWVRFDFPRIPTTTIEAYLRSLGFGPAASKVSAKRADGDLRAALNSVNSPDSKDVVVEGLDGVDLVLSRAALTVRDAMVMHEPSVVAMGVFENYHAILAKNDTGIADVVSDAFSMADVFDEKMFATQQWDLAGFYAATAIAAPAMAIRERPGRKSTSVEKFGSVWSKAYNARAKAKNVKTINVARSVAGLTCMSVEDLALHRLIVTTALATTATGVATTGVATTGVAAVERTIREACEPLGEAELLLLMRLGVGSGIGASYKHGRLKKIMTARAPVES